MLGFGGAKKGVGESQAGFRGRSVAFDTAVT